MGAANGDTLVRYLQAYIEGLRFALDPANRLETIELLAKGLNIPRTSQPVPMRSRSIPRMVS